MYENIDLLDFFGRGARGAARSPASAAGAVACRRKGTNGVKFNFPGTEYVINRSVTAIKSRGEGRALGVSSLHVLLVVAGGGGGVAARNKNINRIDQNNSWQPPRTPAHLLAGTASTRARSYVSQSMGHTHGTRPTQRRVDVSISTRGTSNRMQLRTRLKCTASSAPPAIPRLSKIAPPEWHKESGQRTRQMRTSFAHMLTQLHGRDAPLPAARARLLSLRMC
ncbi:hypothetical protein EVAR_30510_1 [Eumeta japonica]|uniref:Uncharacterized protein n=1 Tax=Eumeta variegata TaxID=151549 RepID=A0A4C1VWP2_EUMVA|nr:hypothetical protein EVAR_30510_1 [Eumeta japonica]